MSLTPKVKEILSWYESDSPGTKANLVRMLNHGKLGGTGKLVILPVDQGFEHGPERSFAKNPDAYNPHYHFQLAIDAGLSAYAAPLGMIEAGAGTFAGQIPLILKVNSSNSLLPKANMPDQAITGTVKDALRLGCGAIGLTIYPGSSLSLNIFEEARELIAEAKAAGLVAVVWSYPRGADLDKNGETALDVCAYAAHIAALLGAHIIKVKPPTTHLGLPEAKKAIEDAKVPNANLSDGIKHIMQTTFGNRRLVIFSGGAAKGTKEVLEEIQGIANGGGHGAIIGRNVFQRPKAEALAMLEEILAIYKKA